VCERRYRAEAVSRFPLLQADDELVILVRPDDHRTIREIVTEALMILKPQEHLGRRAAYMKIELLESSGLQIFPKRIGQGEQLLSILSGKRRYNRWIVHQTIGSNLGAILLEIEDRVDKARNIRRPPLFMLGQKFDRKIGEKHRHQNEQHLDEKDDEIEGILEPGEFEEE
jgi:hypothetical protein